MFLTIFPDCKSAYLVYPNQVNLLPRIRNPIRSGGFLYLKDLQRFTNVGFKVAGKMPIVTLLDITSNPLVVSSVWSPIPNIYFAPEYVV